MISKSFQGSQGRAYLFDQVVNVSTGPAEERVLLTGLHHVADIYCQRYIPPPSVKITLEFLEAVSLTFIYLAAKQHLDGNTNMPSKLLRSTKKESSSLSLFICLKTMDGKMDLLDFDV